MRNPFLKNIIFYIAAWSTVAVVDIVILSRYYNLSLSLAIADSLVYNLLYANIAMNFWYPVKYLNLEKQKPFVVLMVHVIAALIVISLWLIAGNFIMNWIAEENEAYKTFALSAFLGRAVSGMLYYFIIVLIYYLYIYYFSFREKLTREADLRTLVKETELSLLRSQLNPHFIFNSLNSISSLTITNPAKAQDMLVKLSSYLRFALEHNKNSLISFEKELENSLLYLEIEKVRFGEKLIFEKEISTETMYMQVPNMILQPLLENAIKHGVYESQEPVVIHLSASKENNFLCIHISNNFEKYVVSKKGRGIGLRNVQERLLLIYNKKDLMKTTVNGSVFEVELFIPQQ
ncbi:MAG TPA: histidine kinase [Cytophagaceae bacterium]|nr:histidine kinase [Cytophagaceae bacterium]